MTVGGAHRWEMRRPRLLPPSPSYITNAEVMSASAMKGVLKCHALLLSLCWSVWYSTPLRVKTAEVAASAVKIQWMFGSPGSTPWPPVQSCSPTVSL